MLLLKKSSQFTLLITIIFIINNSKAAYVFYEEDYPPINNELVGQLNDQDDEITFSLPLASNNFEEEEIEIPTDILILNPQEEEDVEPIDSSSVIEHEQHENYNNDEDTFDEAWGKRRIPDESSMTNQPMEEMKEIRIPENVAVNLGNQLVSLEAENILLKEQVLVLANTLNEIDRVVTEEEQNVQTALQSEEEAKMEKRNDIDAAAAIQCPAVNALTDNCQSFLNTYGLQMDADAQRICRVHEICYSCAYPVNDALLGCDGIYQQQVNTACESETNVAKCHFEADRLLQLIRGYHLRSAEIRTTQIDETSLRDLCEAPCTLASILM